MPMSHVSSALAVFLARSSRKARRRAKAFTEQVRVPYPPYELHPEPGVERRPAPAELPSASYLSHRVRLWVGERVIELAPGRGDARPADLGLGAPLVVMSGCCPPERRSSAVDNAASLARFSDDLTDLLGRQRGDVDRFRSVFLPDSRAWVEPGEAIVGVPLAAVREFVSERDLRGFAVWDDTGLRFERRDGTATTARQVRLREVRPGCPMRTDEAARQCLPHGGPWVAAAQRAGLFWTAHQRMLADALGCGVCRPDRTDLPDVVAAGELIQPSRCGGWDFAGSTATAARLG